MAATYGAAAVVSVSGTVNAQSASRVKANLLAKETNWELGPVLRYRMECDNVDNRQVDNMKDVDSATELGACLGWKMD